MNQPPSEFRRGWSVLVAAAFGTAFGASPLPFNSVGSFTKPLAAEFGWGRGEIMLALFSFTAAVVITVPIVGSLADRYGVRRIALATLAAFGICYGALGFTPASLTAFYLLWFLMGALGGGSTPVTWTRAVNAWFQSSRGFALAITLMGTGLTAMLLPSFATWLIANYGWRAAFLGIAGLPLLVALPVALWGFREPTVEESTPAQLAIAHSGLDLPAALRGYRFWVIALAVLCISFGVGGSMTHFQPLLIDRGFTPAGAAKIAGVIGLSVIIGRLLAGWLVDRYWAPAVTFPLLALPAVACLLLARASVPEGAALLSACLIGLSAGAETDLLAFLTARYFGLAHYGKLYGMLYSVFGLASGLAPWMFGHIFDATKSYGLALHTAAVLFVVGALSLLTLGRYPTFAPNRSVR
ncbi:MAG TPA: MFS transporter [Steroidobacteraceae bacterium]|nr:MFS transporter [Steroidobacteraceae bacterium]